MRTSNQVKRDYYFLPISFALSLALLALLALSGCGGGGGSSSGATGSIAGTVLAGRTRGQLVVHARTTARDASQQPVAGATVTVSGYPNLTTQTDASGNFQINSVPVGQQNVLISASGYNMLTIPVSVQAGSTITQVTIPTATAANYQWTVLVYLDANNDLEAYGLMNMLQMEAVGSTNKVAILVQFARPASGKNSSAGGYPYSLLGVNGTWGGTASDTRRYLVTKNPSNNPTVMSSTVLADLGPTNMGRPTTLHDFIVWGEQYAPAQHYMLVLWDHGSGWSSKNDATRAKARAICFDDTFQDQIRDVELSAALTAPKHLDIVATDACLMAMAEVAYEIKDQTSYLVASEDEEPACGLPYTDIITQLTSQPAISPQLYAKYIARNSTSYWNSPAGSGDTRTCCSVIDLSQMQAVADAMAPFTARLLAVGSIYPAQLNTLLNWPYLQTDSTQRFGSSVGYFFADLVDYATRVDTTINDPQLHTAVQNLVSAINNAVIETDTNSGDPNAHGMSIYFPSASFYNGKSSLNQFYGNPLSYYPLLSINSVTNWGTWLSRQPT